MAALNLKKSLVAGDYVMTAEDFTQIAATLKERTGIVLTEGKIALAYSRLAKRLRLLGLRSFEDYCAMLNSPDGSEELQEMLAALTTNVSRFYREPHHFETLQKVFASGIAQRARTGERIRLWSAGCSNGQEPYSMAMALLAAMPDAASFDIKILATDIDPNVVADGRKGVYRTDLLAPAPEVLRNKYFQPFDEHRLVVKESLAQLITFNVLNLIGPWPMKHKFDFIFCRNVAIYFDEQAQERLWARFAQATKAGAYLCIGHSERVTGPGERYFETAGLTTYVRGPL
ncbi:CheR family methyltransferase [Candidatus Phycosocius spiralis]|uniref:Chemotaxis protein methyltransferase n=1 Tax=Candidatus Phycosocius spiralis TaxID=2815099 RepID=A0ABQ4PXS8_9PROT|nr:protein-glutamate O-methyltransferase [Candidatus Phycosocius spiralis]GIU67780.1 chemotaxis protein methyltransferase [Candidatus Phycosocius spiralis]